MLSINVLLQPHVFNSSFYFLSSVRAKKKGKNLYQFFIQKLRVRVIYEYANNYGKSVKILSNFQNQVPLCKFKSPIQDFLTTVLVFKPHIFSRDSLVAFNFTSLKK